MDQIAEPGLDAQSVRPSRPAVHSLRELARLTGARLADPAAGDLGVSGVVLNSREVQPGDLYAALPGSRFHGAAFAADAAAAGAVAVLTDAAGARELEACGVTLPVLLSEDPRAWTGTVAAAVYDSQPDAAGQRLFAVTGTNGKTTTTYFITSVLRALGRRTGLIGTIEILAGDTPIPSRLTTPEAPHVHALLARMRERGITDTAMEVSSHALQFHRVDGVRFTVAGFTNLTQDHLDLHGSMAAYFEAKARLFTPERAERAVVVLGDEHWSREMARRAREALGGQNVTTVALHAGTGTETEAGATGGPEADWRLGALRRRGVGHAFELHHRDGRTLRVSTALPGDFNVANAALAVLMVLDSGVAPAELQAALDEHDPLTTDVPGRMQLIGARPTAVVDFAHNPDALAQALHAVEPTEAGGRIIVVFGATGKRDVTKRPIMGEVAARGADIVIVTDDEPHHEDPAPIREQVAAGARRAQQRGARAREVLVIAPRETAIRAAVRMARPEDSVIVAGRGHEVFQELDGAIHPLDDRVELRAALDALHLAHEEQQ